MGGGPVAYISDCQIETDREAVIPDSYVSSAGEKLQALPRVGQYYR